MSRMCSNQRITTKVGGIVLLVQYRGVILGLHWRIMYIDPHSYQVWCGLSVHKKSLHQGNYHKVFNGENFVAWWHNQLLPNFNSPSLIILDIAKYHLVKAPDTPKPNQMKKQ